MTRKTGVRKAISIVLAILLTLGEGFGDSLAFAKHGKGKNGNTNRPPVMKPLSDFVFSTDLPVEFQVEAEDPDGDRLRFFVRDLPPGAEFKKGVFTWFPEEIHVGEYITTFGVSDGKHKVEQTIFLFVLPGNLANAQVESGAEGIGREPAAEPRIGTKGTAQVSAGGSVVPSFMSAAIPGTGVATGGGGGGGGVAILGGQVSGGTVLPATTPTTTTTTPPPEPAPPPTPTPQPPAINVKFTDQTAAVGIGSLLNSESIAAGDLTGDGKMDLLVARPIGSYSIFANNGNGTFREIILLNLGNAFAGGVGTLGDFTNDGHLDIFIARNGSDFLLRSNGDGTFQDVTAQAGVSSAATSLGALFADYDRDGFVDLFVVNSNQPSTLFRNLGNGTFQDATGLTGIQNGATDENRAAAFLDVDNDDDLDLYVVNYLTANVLYVNQGNGSFARSQTAGVQDAGPGVGVAVGDFNHDGFTDLFALNDSDVASPFYQNNGNGTFTNIASQVALPSLGLNPRGAALADFNNDGFLDLYLARNSEPNLLLANDGSGKFVDKTTDSATPLPLVARQIAFGDYDEDGFIDLFVAGNPLTVYRNESPKTTNFVQIRTVGTRSNRSGFGARLELQAGSRRGLRHVKEGVSNTKESPVQTLGIGASTSLDSFVIRWPSGTVQDVRAKTLVNRLNVIRENAAPVLTVTGPSNVDENQTLTLNLQTQDPDNSGGAQNDTLVLSVDQPVPSNSTFTDNGNGIGTFTFTPDSRQSGQYTLIFRATDGDLTDVKTVLITVNNLSRPPTISPLQNQTLNEGTSLQFVIIGQDPDGDALTFSITTPTPAPRNAGLAPDPNDPNRVFFSFNPDFDQAGVYDFLFTVSDGSNTASAPSRITVVNVNRVPVLDAIGDRTVNEGEALSFTVTGSDPDNDPITFSATGLPTNASFNPTSRIFSFNPNFNQAGDYNVTFRVSDGNLVAERTIKITVQDVIPPGPRTPKLVDPGIANFSGQFTLRWSDETASGAVIYEVQESNSPDFQSVLRSFFPSGNLEPVTVNTSGTYFYRVRALNDLPQNGGIASQFSNVVNLCVDLERDLDILNVFPNQGIIDGNAQASQSNRQIVNDPGGLGTLGTGNSIRFNYDLHNQDLTGLFFENNGAPVNIASFKTVNLRLRGDAEAGFPVKVKIEMRRGGNFASLVLFFRITDQYQDFSFPFFQRISDIDTMTILVEGDTAGGDGFGTVFVDEFFLSRKSYLANAKPDIPANSGAALSDDALLDKVESQASHYFFDQILGPGYVKDADNKDFASVAATGFGLTSLTVLASRFDSSNPNWNRVTTAQARQRAEAIMDDILRVQGLQVQNPQQFGVEGFLYHFIQGDGSRHGTSEVSSVDHALLLAGVLTAGEFFGGNLKTKAEQILLNTRWTLALTPNNQFYRTWTPEHGLVGVYDFYTDEILLMSLLAIATDPNNLAFLRSFYAFPRKEGSYRGGTGEEFRFVNSFFGSFFTYLYAHCWFDFENLGADKPNLVPGAASTQSVNWWVNSIQGARSNRQFSIDRSPFFPFSYHSKSWGISAVQRPDEIYEGLYGAPPHEVGAHDGTVAVYAPLSGLPFFRTLANEPLADNQAFQVLRFYYDNFFSQLFGAYGPTDSLNNEGEFSQRYLGIDLGPEVVMMENYRTRLIWNTFKQNARIRAATEKIFGTSSGQDQFSLAVRNVSDNQPAANSKIDFGLNPGGTAFASGQQYLDLAYNLSIANAGLCIYTDNREFTGQGEGAGMIGQTDKSEAVPMFWTAFDTVSLGGFAFTGDANLEEPMQDRRRGDFLNPIVTKKRVIVDGTGAIMPSRPGFGQDTSPIFVYFGVNFEGASAQTYKGTIVIEVCHFS